MARRATLILVVKTGFSCTQVKLLLQFVKFNGVLAPKKLSEKCQLIDLHFKLGGIQTKLRLAI